MFNDSKKRDYRFWEKCSKSGGVAIVQAKKHLGTNTAEMYLRSIDAYLLNGSHTTSEGKISSFGSVRILAGSVFEQSAKKSFEDCGSREGLELWSPILYSLSKGNFKAKVKNDTVVIQNEENNAVMTASCQQLFPVSMNLWEHVRNEGWLMFESSEMYSRDLPQILTRAQQGIKPPYFDNSAFIKVSPKLLGERLLVLYLRTTDFRQTAVRVFTENGELVEHEVYHPISFKLWAPESFEATFRN